LKAFSTDSAMRLLRDRSAAAAIEYALVVALAAAAIGVGTNRLNDAVGAVYRQLDSELSARTAFADSPVGHGHTGNAWENRAGATVPGREPWAMSDRGSGVAARTGAGASQPVALGYIASGSTGVTGSDDADYRSAERRQSGVPPGGSGAGQLADAGTRGAADNVTVPNNGKPYAGRGAFALVDAENSAANGASSGVRSSGTGTPGGDRASGQSDGAGKTDRGGGTSAGMRIVDLGAGAPFGRAGAEEADAAARATKPRAESGKPTVAAAHHKSLRDHAGAPALGSRGAVSPMDGTIILVISSIIAALFPFAIIMRACISRRLRFENRRWTGQVMAVGTCGDIASRVRR